MDPELEAAYEALYEGNKAKVRPVGDAVLAAAEELGRDVIIDVTNLYVSLATAKRQFGLFFPASGRRVTVRLRLDGSMPHGRGRLESTAHLDPNGRFDLRAYLAHVDHVDDDLRVAMRKARDLAR